MTESCEDTARRDGLLCDETIVDEAAVRRAQAAIDSDEAAKALTDIFGALSDRTRLKILQALSSGEMCVCDIASAVGASQSAVSHQLRVLRDLDLVAFDREGRRAVYRLADAHVGALLAQGHEHALERLAK